RTEDAGRVVDEREVVEYADPARVEVHPTPEGIDEPAVVLALQRHGHRVDREVAAKEVLADRRVLDRRQRGRGVVELGAGGHDVDTLAVPVDDDRGAELLVRTYAAAQRVGERLCERNRVALDRDIDVEAALSEEDVPHSPADEIHALEVAAQGGDGLED